MLLSVLVLVSAAARLAHGDRGAAWLQLPQPPAAVYMFANTELTISSVPILASMFPEMVHTGNGTPI